MLWSVFFVVALSIPLSSNEYYDYFCFAFFVVAGTLEKYILYSNRKSTNAVALLHHNRLYKYPFIMMCIWGYGGVIGLLSGNELRDIIRNFIGIVCYSFFYVLMHRKPVDDKVLLKAVYKASIIATMFIIVVFELNSRELQIWPFSNVPFYVDSMTVYSSVEALIFILEAVSMWNIFAENNSIRKKGIYAILFILATWALLGTNTMGGFRLGYIAILAIILYCVALRKLGFTRRQKYAFDTILIVIVLGIVVCDFVFGGIISEIFSSSDAGNSKRMYQIEMVIDRFKVWGNGNGAQFVYTFGKREYASYGIEVSYLNMIDKYGILALVMFYILFSPIWRSMNALVFRKKGALTYVMVIGASGYMFIALGNPVIFSCYNVMLHSVMLYLLATKAVEERVDATTV